MSAKTTDAPQNKVPYFTFYHTATHFLRLPRIAPLHNKKTGPPKKSSPVKQYLKTCFLLTNNTRTLDTFNKGILSEEEDDEEGKDNQKTCGVEDCRFIQFLSNSCCGHRSRHFNKAGQKLDGCLRGIQKAGVECICPRPREGKHEYGYHHRNGQRKNDAEVCLEDTRTVNICSFFEFVGHALIELTEDEDIKTVLESETCKRQQEQRPVSIGELKTCCVGTESDCTLENFDDTVDIEISELVEHRKHKCLLRDNHGKDYEHKDDSAALKLELCKAVTDKSCDECLNDSCEQRKGCGVEQTLKVVVVKDDGAVGIKGGVLRNKFYSRVSEVCGAEER